jgi:hypothetical protein
MLHRRKKNHATRLTSRSLGYWTTHVHVNVDDDRKRKRRTKMGEEEVEKLNTFYRVASIKQKKKHSFFSTL